MTDPTITIAGLRARINSLLSAVQHSNRTTAERVTMFVEASSNADRLTAERDALAAELAQVRAAADAAALLHQQATTAYEGERADAARLRAELAAVRRELEAPADVTNLTAYASGVSCARSADERSAEVARLTARVAELEARPVLDIGRLAAALNQCEICPSASDIMRHLGPVTLPTQDRAEELNSAYESARMAYGPGVEAMRAALAKLGAAQGPTAASLPVFSGVSVEELARTFWCATGRGYKPEQWATLAPGTQAEWIRGTAAVLARLEASLVAPVDPEAVAMAATSNPTSAQVDAVQSALAKRSIPVTPELDAAESALAAEREVTAGLVEIRAERDRLREEMAAVRAVSMGSWLTERGRLRSTIASYQAAAVAIADALDDAGGLGPVDDDRVSDRDAEFLRLAEGLAGRVAKAGERAVVAEREAYGYLQERDAAISRADLAESALAAAHRKIDSLDKCATSAVDGMDAEIGRLRARVAELEDRLSAAGEGGGTGVKIARLRAEVSALRSRPVLTVDMYRAAVEGAPGRAEQVVALLGPVTLPWPDRAEELAAAIYGGSFAELNDAARAGMVERTRAALAKLGAAQGPTAASLPVFSGVSVEELARTFWCATGRGYKPEQWATLAPGTQAEWIRGTAAVLARLEASLVAPVDPEAILRAGAGEPGACVTTYVWPDAIRAVRTALVARGIPVTPEVGK